MIATFQGYNGKKNKAMMVCGLVSGMAALARGTNTLIIQLIDPDVDTIEYTLAGRDVHKTKFDKEENDTSFSDEGIDALFRAAETSKLMKGDFDQYCTNLIEKENGLDVTAITKNSKFHEIVLTKLDLLEKICLNAREIYDNIIILMPTGNRELSRRINGDSSAADKKTYRGIADMSFYCLKQGFTKKAPVYGRRIIYVVPDFEPASKFSLKSIKKEFVHNQEELYKIDYNVGAYDAYMTGKLLEYIRANRDNESNDSNYEWSEDIKNLVRALENLGSKEEVVDLEWERLQIERERELRSFPIEIIDGTAKDTEPVLIEQMEDAVSKVVEEEFTNTLANNVKELTDDEETEEETLEYATTEDVTDDNLDTELNETSVAEVIEETKEILTESSDDTVIDEINDKEAAEEETIDEETTEDKAIEEETIEDEIEEAEPTEDEAPQVEGEISQIEAVSEDATNKVVEEATPEPKTRRFPPLSFFGKKNKDKQVNVPVDSDEPVIAAQTDTEDDPVIEEESANEEPVLENEPVIEEEPVAEEEPILEEEPIIEEEPVLDEEPAIEEEPVAEEEAVIEEDTSLEEEPVLEDESVAEDTPVIETEEDPVEDVETTEEITDEDDTPDWNANEAYYGDTLDPDFEDENDLEDDMPAAEALDNEEPINYIEENEAAAEEPKDEPEVAEDMSHVTPPKKVSFWTKFESFFVAKKKPKKEEVTEPKNEPVEEVHEETVSEETIDEVNLSEPVEEIEDTIEAAPEIIDINEVAPTDENAAYEVASKLTNPESKSEYSILIAANLMTACILYEKSLNANATLADVRRMLSQSSEWSLENTMLNLTDGHPAKNSFMIYHNGMDIDKKQIIMYCYQCLSDYDFEDDTLKTSDELPEEEYTFEAYEEPEDIETEESIEEAAANEETAEVIDEAEEVEDETVIEEAELANEPVEEPATDNTEPVEEAASLEAEALTEDTSDNDTTEDTVEEPEVEEPETETTEDTVEEVKEETTEEVTETVEETKKAVEEDDDDWW